MFRPAGGVHSNFSSSSFEPVNLLMRNFVVMFENPTYPKICRGVKITQAHFLADQIRRLGNPSGGVDKNETMAEAAMQKYRYGDKRQAKMFSDQVIRHGKFGDIKFAVANHPSMTDVRRHVGEIVSSMPSGSTVLSFNARIIS